MMRRMACGRQGQMSQRAAVENSWNWRERVLWLRETAADVPTMLPGSGVSVRDVSLRLPRGRGSKPGARSRLTPWPCKATAPA
jgi:hypothetical protein